MISEELSKLEKDVKRTKRLASEQAMVLHDLIEDRLPDAFQELPAIAQAVFDACQAWDEANRKWRAAQGA
jgi:hypothetical protein